MLIHSKAYGPVEVDDRQRISFPAGLLGFENLTDFVLMDARQQPFYWLQSLEVEQIAFVLIDPRLFRPEYKPGVDPSDLEILGLAEGDQDLLNFAIVTIPEDQERMTANLQGPVLINRVTRNGRQCISTDPRWRVRHNILEELAADTGRKGEAC